MPIDPYAALNAMLRAEAARFTPPVRQTEPAEPAAPVAPVAPVTSLASESEQQQNAPADPAA
ncbi:hypothetical protein [Streptomyces sp. NPDC059874]|uniref:hypothetical protein n=1 Tax=Streptomyces sp. NPDC059874 TaxID=3346983 RepID=UPI00366789B6